MKDQEPLTSAGDDLEKEDGPQYQKQSTSKKRANIVTLYRRVGLQYVVMKSRKRGFC